jgi:hypothetical protein
LCGVIIYITDIFCDLQLEQRAAIIKVIEGEEVDESSLPVLPEVANAPKRFAHTKDGKPPRVHTLQSRYGHLAHTNVSITKWNTLDALKEKYDKKPGGSGVKVKQEEEEDMTVVEEPKQKLPTTMAQRRSRGRDRTSRSVTGSSAADTAAASASAAASAVPVKVEGEDDNMEDASEEVVDLDDDTIRYGEFGKPAHVRQSVIRSKLSRKRSKSKSKGGFLNCQFTVYTYTK